MQGVFLVMLAKAVVTLKLESMGMWKKIKKKSSIYKHLHNNEECFSGFNSDCFSILDYAPTRYQIKTKEGIILIRTSQNVTNN